MAEVKMVCEAVLPHMGLRRTAKIREVLKVASQDPEERKRVGIQRRIPRLNETLRKKRIAQEMSNHPSAKLRPDDVKRIIQMKGTKSQREVAIEFGVSRELIRGIWLDRTWRHIERPWELNPNPRPQRRRKYYTPNSPSAKDQLS